MAKNKKKINKSKKGPKLDKPSDANKKPDNRVEKPDNRTDKRKIGDLGEDIACQFLVQKGHEIIDRNYLKKWGEIDIVSCENGTLHFIEVKTVSRPPKLSLGLSSGKNNWHYPEQNVHPWKVKRLKRTLQTYLLEKRVSPETIWQVDIIAVFLDMDTRKAKIRVMENVIL